MAIQCSDFIDVPARAESLGCCIPTGIALLPRNFETADSKEDLIHEGTAPTVRILLRKNSISETPLEHTGERFPQISEKAFADWIGPTIFLSFALYSENPHLISVALSVIANYLTDLFKGLTHGRNVRLDIAVETEKGNYRKIHYEGNVSGMESLAKVVREATRD